MNTCDSCKWWIAALPEEDCEIGVMRFCKNSKLHADLFDDHDLSDEMGQFGMDAGYPVQITGPKFGCIHHETK